MWLSLLRYLLFLLSFSGGIFQPIELTKTLMCAAFAFYAIAAMKVDAGMRKSWMESTWL
jgi:hypothetical protein